jgi:hypothetical protein
MTPEKRLEILERTVATHFQILAALGAGKKAIQGGAEKIWMSLISL